MTRAALTSHIDAKVVATQATFRAVMDAMARPGRIQSVTAGISAPSPMMATTAAMAQTLFDHDTPLWLDATIRRDDVVQWLRFHTSSPIVDAQDQASFALIGDVTMMPPVESFAFGSADFPDRSITLIVQVDALDAGSAWQLSGPGIDGSIAIRADASLRHLFGSLAINTKTFPRGIDIVLVSNDLLLAIPRTTRLKPMES